TTAMRSTRRASSPALPTTSSITTGSSSTIPGRCTTTTTMCAKTANGALPSGSCTATGWSSGRCASCGRASMPDSDSIRLDGKVALVTGGGAGIGGGITRVLARAGATVVINDIEPSYAEEAAAAVAAEGGKTVLAVGDIRDAD